MAVCLSVVSLLSSVTYPDSLGPEGIQGSDFFITSITSHLYTSGCHSV